MQKYRKITANFIFPVSNKPVKNGILVLDEKGTILDLIDRQEDNAEIEGLEYYNGIICPGFVNAHCHLEFSHLKGVIAECKGLTDFLNRVFLHREDTSEKLIEAARQADLFMFKSGVVAVGDISNSANVLEVKEKSKLFYHTFIEVFGFNPQRAQRAMEYAEFVSRLYHASNQSYSISPHATYSTSYDLLELIGISAIGSKLIHSLHHQESDEEDKLFFDKTGDLVKHYQDNLKIETSGWKPTGKSATESIVPRISKDVQLLLVHNTYLNEKHCNWLIQNRSAENTMLVTCPKSNLFIENRLPNYELWKKTGFPICVGTDSLASNDTLSMLEELKCINSCYPSISLNELLNWACINGAKALKIDDWCGSFEKGKKPGVNLISGIDFKTMQLTSNSKVRKLA